MITFKNRLQLLAACCLLVATTPMTFAQTFDRATVLEIAKASIAEKLERSTIPASELNLPTVSENLHTRSDDEDNLTESEEPESEVHAAINPADTNNIIVGAMKFSPGDLLSALSFSAYYTRDFGQTWQQSEFDGAPPSGLILGGGDPIIAFDNDGVAYYFWLTIESEQIINGKASLHWAISEDGGATWTRQDTPVDSEIFTSVIAPTSGSLVDKEWVAVDRSNSEFSNSIYISYVHLGIENEAASYEMLVKYKRPGVDTFSTAAIASSPDMAFVQFASIDVDSRGDVHLMFLAGSAEATGTVMYHTKSIDGGVTFDTPTAIGGANIPCFPPGSNPECEIVGIDPNRMYPCNHMRVDRSGGPNDGNLYAVWTANGLTEANTAGVDIYYSKSVDGGDTWTEPKVLNDDPDPATHNFFPALHVNDKGTVIVSWYDRREDPENLDTKYYITYSEDGGESFVDDFPVATEASDFSMIGSANANFGVGEYTQVIATSSYAIPFWCDGRGNDGNVEIFTSFIPLFDDLSTNTVEVGVLSTKMAVYGPNPNPAQSASFIDVDLKEASNTSIRIIDQSGRLVSTLLNNTALPTGTHRIELPVAQLAAGTYTVSVETKFGFRSKPFIVTK